MKDTLLLSLKVGGSVVSSIVILFLLMAIGFFFAKKNIITQSGVKQMTELLINAIVPCALVNAYQREFDASMVKNLLIALLFALIIHVLGMFVMPLFFKQEQNNNHRIGIFSAMYSNAGFMGLPLAQTVYGQEGLFYAVAYLAVFNIFVFTHGVYTYTKDPKSLSLKSIIINPGVLGTLLGVALFLLRIKLPDIVGSTVSYLAALNTPLPMIILGTYLVNFDMKKVIKSAGMWKGCVLRLLVFPLLAVIVADIMAVPNAVKLPLVMLSACPVAVITTLFATKYGLDSEHASQMVSLTHILSIITIPLIMIITVLF